MSPPHRRHRSALTRARSEPATRGSCQTRAPWTDTARRPAGRSGAQRHLWMHFTRLPLPTSARGRADHRRGEGCYVCDTDGKRYLDGLSGLFTVQVGHGRAELADAAAEQAAQARLLPDLVVRPRAGDRARRAARRGRARATSTACSSPRRAATPSSRRSSSPASTSSCVGEPMRTKVISRTLAYHGTSMGALSVTGVPAIKAPFEPLRARLRQDPDAVPVPLHRLLPPRRVHAALRRRPRAADRDGRPRNRGGGVHRAGPEHRRGVRAAARLLRARPRDLRPSRRAVRERRGDLRVRTLRAPVRQRSLRLPARHDHVRQGCHQRLLTARRRDRQRPSGRAVPRRTRRRSCRARRSAPTRCRARSPTPTSTCSSATTSAATCSPTRTRFKSLLDGLRDIPLVGDVRGDGYFYAIELVPDGDARHVHAPTRPTGCCAASCHRASTTPA